MSFRNLPEHTQAEIEQAGAREIERVVDGIEHYKMLKARWGDRQTAMQTYKATYGANMSPDEKAPLQQFQTEAINALGVPKEYLTPNRVAPKTLHDFWHEFRSNPAELDALRYHVRGSDGRTEYASINIEDARAYAKLRNETSGSVALHNGPVTLWLKVEL